MLFHSPRVIRVEQHCARWELQPDFAPILESVLNSHSDIVKQSPAKCVTRHETTGKVWFVKRYLHSAVALRPLKFYFKASQARQEWQLAQRLETLCVPVVRHVALGERWGFGLRESILITEGFDGVSLDESPDFDAHAVLSFVNQLHAGGVLQRDLHPGNILCHKHTQELRLVDVHGTIIKPSLSKEECAKNLAFLRMFRPLPVPDDIATRSERMRREYFEYRSRRCLKHNREFEPRRFPPLLWHARIPLLTTAAEQILRDPDGFLASSAEILKPGRSSTVGRADGLVLKRANLRKPENLLKDFFRESKARRSYVKAYHLELAGIPTARSIATADRRAFGLLLRSYFLMEEIPGAQHLGQWRGNATHAALQLARLLAKLHNEGFSHRDLKETNLVFNSAGKLFVIDLDGLEYAGVVTRERALADLTRLARAAEGLPGYTVALRRLFVLRYAKDRGIRPGEFFTRALLIPRGNAPEK